MPDTYVTAPLVTVGLPCYNSERYLSQSIESLLAQTFRDFVLVISDNASTDKTGEICQHYARQDPRIRYHRNATNIGLTGNFNRVFELSNTKYFKWATADDFWAPELLADAVAVLEEDPSVAVCYPRAILVDAEGKETQAYDDKLHLMQSDPAERFRAFLENVGLVNHHLGLLRSDVIKKTKLFGKHTGADIGFLAEMSLYGKFYEIKKYLFFRRFHSDSSSWNRRDEAQAARRFYATNTRRMPFLSWRKHATYMSAVRRSPLPFATKVSLLAFLVRRAYWQVDALSIEVVRDTPTVVQRMLKGKK